MTERLKRLIEELPPLSSRGERDLASTDPEHWHGDEAAASIPSAEYVAADGTPLTSDGPRVGSDHIPFTIGRYQIRRLLGHGGFGKVYLANDLNLERRVAVKIPHDLLCSSDPGMIWKEARSIARLDNPGIVPILEIGTFKRMPYLVTRYVEGDTLDVRIRCGLDPQQLDGVVSGIANALACVHEQGIVHRDLKPSNIIVRSDGSPCIIDFGLALRADEQADGFAGTLAYMSPEQLRQGRLTYSSDVYSFGLMLFELLTGRRMRNFEGMEGSQLAYVELCSDRVKDELVTARDSLKNSRSDLARICLTCLSESPSGRFPSAKELVRELKPELHGNANTDVVVVELRNGTRIEIPGGQLDALRVVVNGVVNENSSTP